MWPAAKASRPVPSGRQRTSRIRTSGRARFSASQSGEARSSGRTWAPAIAAYHTDPMPDPTEAQRRADPDRETAGAHARPEVRILDVRWRPDGTGRLAFAAGHIPNATYLDWHAAFVDPEDADRVLF